MSRRTLTWWVRFDFGLAAVCFALFVLDLATGRWLWAAGFAVFGLFVARTGLKTLEARDRIDEGYDPDTNGHDDQTRGY